MGEHCQHLCGFHSELCVVAKAGHLTRTIMIGEILGTPTAFFNNFGPALLNLFILWHRHQTRILCNFKMEDHVNSAIFLINVGHSDVRISIAHFADSHNVMLGKDFPLTPSEDR